MMSSFNAIVPMACVTAAAIAVMVAEAFRDPGERMPIGGLGVVGLLGAAIATWLLWDRHAVSFGVVAADNFGLFVTGILIVTLASIGLPGLNGFVGEFLILLGVFRWNPRMAAFAATGVILSATYMLWMFQRVNYGPVSNEKNAALPDLRPREWAVIVPIIVLAVLMGVFPNLFLRPIEPSVERMLNHVQRGAASRIQAQAAPAAGARP